MAQADKVREQIGLFKYWIGIILGILVGVSAWLFNNIEQIAIWKAWLSGLLIIFCVIVIVVLNHKLVSAIDKLEEL